MKTGYRAGKGRIFFLLVCLVMCVCSCGKPEEKQAERVYVPDFLTDDKLQGISYYDAVFYGDCLYYVDYLWNEETQTSEYALKSYSLADGTEEEKKLALPEDANISSFALGQDGSVYLALTIYHWDETTGNSGNEILVAKYDGEGSQVYLTELTDAGAGNGNVYINRGGIAVDGQGRCCLISDSGLWLFDAAGNSVGSVSLSGGQSSVDGCFTSGDGTVYVIKENYGGDVFTTSLSPVEFESRSVGESVCDFPSSVSMAPGGENRVLYHDRSDVYVYDLQTKETQKLFNWIDCDINGDSVTAFGALSDGRIAVAYEDFETGEEGVALLTDTPAEQVVQKEQIVVGVMFPDSSFSAAVVQFNKSNDRYHVSVRQYADYNADGENYYEAGLTRLNADLVSDSCPDILSLSSLNWEQLAAKGLFEDLSPYLEQGGKLDRNDMLENILEAYTYDGKLIAIPDSFMVESIVGSASQVGQEPGWTLEDMIAFADAHPEADLFDTTTREGVLRYCLNLTMDDFVDWESGKCSFDGEEFRNLLNFVKDFPESYEYDEDAPSEPERIQAGEVLLTTVNFSDFEDIQLYREMFGGDITCIGYPNSDGSSGSILYPMNLYAITSKSDQKEGAWDFLEYFLTREDTGISWGFPNSRSELETMAAEAVEQKYVLDENGDPMLDDQGNPILEGGSHGVGYGNWWYYYRIPTQDEVDMMLALIESAVPGTYVNDQIMSLILEEAGAFFQGQKSVEDVTSVIQSRVGNYVSENS